MSEGPNHVDKLVEHVRALEPGSLAVAEVYELFARRTKSYTRPETRGSVPIPLPGFEPGFPP